MSLEDDPYCPPFGAHPFDLFIIEKWDCASPLGKEEQKRALVIEWIGLGQFGRNKYYQLLETSDDGTIPEDVPQDLLTAEERKVNGENPCDVLWIRTWYGTGVVDGTKNDMVTRASADASYRRLYRRAILSLPEGCEENEPRDGYDVAVRQRFIFDDDPLGLGVLKQDPEDDVVQVGAVPAFVVSAFMRNPDSIYGTSVEEWRNYDAEATIVEEKWLATAQHILLLVADRKACEQGWVLQVALNHKGQVLPTRLRSKAGEILSHVNQWVQLAHPIDVEVPPSLKDTIIYTEEGDGWAEDWPVCSVNRF